VRILSLGVGLPDAAIDNYNWASSLSFYDYDAIIVDPALSVSRMIDGVAKGDGEYKTYEEVPIADGPTSSDSVGLADLLRRRKDETERLLARGGIVVVFGQPDVPHTRVSGFAGAHRYYWLPAPAGADYGPDYVKPAIGRHVNVVDWEHPFANYLDARRYDVLYRASFAEGAAGFPGSRVIARSDGGTAIALEVPVGGGRVIFIPALPMRINPADRSRFANNLVSAIRNSLLTTAEGTAPEWVQEENLPGLDDARRRMEEAEAKLEDLEAELDTARGEYLSIERYRRILWQEGKYGFDLPVRDALTLLGMRQFSQVDQPGHFALGAEAVFLECESSNGAVGMDPHYRLRQRLDMKIADEARTPPHGLVVVNGFREQPPAEREQEYTNALRVAAESMRYTLLKASDLFNAVRDKLEGKSDGKEFCKKLVETEGLFEPPSADEPEPVTASAEENAE
jgi:hypothetical protein